MILELLGLIGIGSYLYGKYGSDIENFNDKYFKKPNKTIVRTRRKYPELDRVLFGKYISHPYDTECFEFNCIRDKVPASNDIRRAIFVSSKSTPRVMLRASCSICDCGDGTYQHRWMVCCANPEDIEYKDELVYAIHCEYLKERILTR